MLQNKHKNQYKKGFSLTELMVVFAMMAVMIGIALGISGNNKKNKDLETAAREVAQAIRQAQNNALNGKLPTSDTTTFACGYVFAFGTDDSQGYETGYVNKNATNCVNNSDITISNRVTLKNGVEFDATFNANKPKAIYFNIPQGEIYEDNNYNEANPKSLTIAAAKMAEGGVGFAISLRLAAGGDERVDICICPSGKIEELPLREGGSHSCDLVCV